MKDIAIVAINESILSSVTIKPFSRPHSSPTSSATGRTIILISEELPELIGMSDRLLIMKDGKITKEFQRSKELSDRDIINYMI